MMAQVVQENDYQEPPTLDSRGEAADHRRGSPDTTNGQRSMSSPRHSHGSVLCLGEAGSVS